MHFQTSVTENVMFWHVPGNHTAGSCMASSWDPESGYSKPEAK
jgi:hypothetical protein